MGLETGNQVGDLNPLNPPGTDPVSQGDDHLRLIKTCLLGSFGDMQELWGIPGNNVPLRGETTTPGTYTDLIKVDAADEIIIGGEIRITATGVAIASGDLAVGNGKLTVVGEVLNNTPGIIEVRAGANQSAVGSIAAEIRMETSDASFIGAYPARMFAYDATGNGSAFGMKLESQDLVFLQSDNNANVTIPAGDLSVTDGALNLRSDAGGTTGASMNFTQDSASPASSDNPMFVRVFANNNALAEIQYGQLRHRLSDAGTGIEKSYWSFQQLNATGALVETISTLNGIVYFSQGQVQIGSAADPRLIIKGNNNTSAGVQMYADSSASSGGEVKFDGLLNEVQLGYTALNVFSADLIINSGHDVFIKNGDLTVSAGELSVGASPATSGIIRIPNNQTILARNGAGSGNVNLIKGNTLDGVEIRGGDVTVKSDGEIQIPFLAGTGTRNVVVDASGNLSAP